jgi:hypothetical protein
LCIHVGDTCFDRAISGYWLWAICLSIGVVIEWAASWPKFCFVQGLIANVGCEGLNTLLLCGVVCVCAAKRCLQAEGREKGGT